MDWLGLIAIVVSVFAVYFAWRSTRATDRNASAAERANALAHEQMQRDREREEQRAKRDAVRWRIEIDRRLVLLRNIGEQTAYDVRVHLDGRRDDDWSDLPVGATIDAGDAHRMRSSSPKLYQSPRPAALLVSWRGSDGWVPVALPASE